MGMGVHLERNQTCLSLLPAAISLFKCSILIASKKSMSTFRFLVIPSLIL